MSAPAPDHSAADHLPTGVCDMLIQMPGRLDHILSGVPRGPLARRLAAARDGLKALAADLYAAHSLRWNLTEAIYNLRLARQTTGGAGMSADEMRRWHVGQATQARGYVRELRRRHPDVNPRDCRCPFWKMQRVNCSPYWTPGEPKP